MAAALYTSAYSGGKWHHFSPSTLQAFKDCARIPFYDKILRLPKRQFKAQALGLEMHGQAEHLIRTGQDVLGPRLAPWRRLLPVCIPDPRVFAEMGLDGKEKKEGIPYDYEQSILWLEGIPVEGYVDLLDLRLDAEPKVTDYKTTKSIAKWAKTEAQLRGDLQLGLYSAAVLERWNPQARAVKARHLYAQTEGAIEAKEVAVTLSTADIDAVWIEAESLARGLKELEGKTTDDDIPQTGIAKGHCQKYGGCSFAGVCLKSPEALLRQRIGVSNSRNENRREELTTREEKNMSLMARIKAAQTQQATPSAPAPASAQAPITCAACGAPTSGEHRCPNPGGSFQVTPAGLRVLYSKDGQIVGTVQPDAAGRAQVIDVPSVAPAASTVSAPPAVGVVPPDAPKNDANFVPPPKKRGRPPKSQAATTPQTAQPSGQTPQTQPGSATTAPARAEPVPSEAPKAENAEAGTARLGIRLFVDCLPSEPYEMLDAYAAEKAAEVSKALQVADYRLTDLGAVKGVGGLAALCREEPPPPGSYVAIVGGFNSPVAVCVDALIPLAAFVVRGVR